MAEVPEPGHVRLQSAARPQLRAGRYEVRMAQEINEGGTRVGDVADVVRHLEVTAPRFNLQPAEVHSVFPPPNASGAFANRLAQVVLRKRSLPWERSPNSSATDPWLGLVILADGEANFMSGVAVADAMPADVRARLGVTETGTCDALEVSSTVVEKAFPAQEDVPLLCHVRQVNLLDSEFAGTDDDGFLSVVVSNRLPAPGQRYGAYLVSFEGQLGVLPHTVDPPAEQVGDSRVYDVSDAQLEAARYSARPGAEVQLSATAQPQTSGSVTARTTEASPWQVPPDGAAAGEPVPTATLGQGFMRHDIDFGALEAAPVLRRFPVLAHWSFTCSTQGDFQTTMAELDVGLLGTIPRASDPGAPPFEVADTGHTAVDHVDRRGDQHKAWYRGAFAPREIARRPAGRPYHAADQALRIADDGRPDISLASAFELGRLLALADPTFVRLLQEWRRGGLVRRRLAGQAEIARAVAPAVRAAAAEGGTGARELGLELLKQVSVDRPTPAGPQPALGPRVPPVDDLSRLVSADDPQRIAAAMGLTGEVVEKMLDPTIAAVALPREPFGSDLRLEFDDVLAHSKQELGALHGRLAARVAQFEAESRQPTDPEDE